jgi:hypothetical protein
MSRSMNGFAGGAIVGRSTYIKVYIDKDRAYFEWLILFGEPRAPA